MLVGNDDLLSGIRFADHFYVPLPPDYDSTKRNNERLPLPVWLFVAFKARTFTPGELTGDHSLRLVLTSPKKKKANVGEHQVTVHEAATALNFRINLELRLKTPGLWWMDVFLDGTHYAKIPFRVVFVPAERGEES